jgi:hypothetical protein
VRPVGGVVTAGVGSAGMPGLFGLLLAMEAGVPVPIPGDLVMLLVGPRMGLTEARQARASALLVAVAWLLRRRAGRSEPTGRMLAEGCCPACLAAGTLAAARLRTRTRTAP